MHFAAQCWADPCTVCIHKRIGVFYVVHHKLGTFSDKISCEFLNGFQHVQCICKKFIPENMCIFNSSFIYFVQSD